MKTTRTRTTPGTKFRPAVHLVAAVLIGAPVLALARDKGKAQDSASYAIIAGTVFRDSGFSLAGADVNLTPESRDDGRKRAKPQHQTTDARGEFAFRVPSGAGRYRVSASAKGFQKQEKTIDVQGEERADVTLTLAQSSNK